MKKLVLLVLFLIQLFAVSAQDKLLLMNGVVDRGKLLSDSAGILKFKIYKNGGKEKVILYDKMRVFAHENIDGFEKMIYKQDTSFGSFYSENQMRMFIYGERDSRKGYGNAPHYLVGGFIGGAFSLIDTYQFSNKTTSGGFFRTSPSIANLLVPFAVTIGATLIKSKIKKEHVSDLTYLSSEEYIEGFNKIRRFKKIKGTFLGSIAGVAVGLISYQLGKP